MISKCENIVINRTKFSEFETFDPSVQSTEGLKLVGFVESVDLCTGETIKKNVSVEYPSSTVKAEIPANYVIPDLTNSNLDTNIISLEPVGTVNCYRVNSNFEGETIQINFKDDDPKNLVDKFFDITINGVTYKTFNISFDRYIPTGKEIKVLFKNFPIYKENCAVRLLDYSKSLNGTPGVIAASEILFSWNEKFIKPENFLVSFVQTLAATALADTENNRKMVATKIEIIN